MRARTFVLAVSLVIALAAAVGGGTALGVALIPDFQEPAVNSMLLPPPGKPIAFQGMLRDQAGRVVKDGAHQVEFAIYSDETTGAPIWHEAQTVTASIGLFSALLGLNTPIPHNLFDGDSNTYLGVKVGSDPEMRPRWRLAYTPYAFFAMTAELSESTSKLDCAGCVGPSHLSFDPTGEKGDKGDIGPKGDPGIQGIQGIQGVKGENGDPGIQGIQGVKGDTGNKGDPGNQGIQGVKGDTGADGANGANGTDGATGPPGPPGPAGIAFSNAFFIEFTNDNVHLVGQISLNAPSAGYVVVQADGMVVWNRYHGNATFQIGIDETSGTFDTNYVTAGGTDGPTTEGNHRFPYSVSRVFKVSAGNKSYFLNAVRFNASGEDPFVVVSSFKAMYFPDALGTANE